MFLQSQKSRCVLVVVAMLMMVGFSYYDGNRQGIPSTNEKLPPFRVIREFSRQEFPPMRKVWILIDPIYFSRENLNKVFWWYSKRSNEPREMLRVLVFTNEARLLQDIENEQLGIGYIDGQSPVITRSGSVNQGRLYDYDAFYRREVKEGGSYVEISELYSYSPSLNNPNDVKTVVLKGEDPFARKNNTISRERSNGKLRTQISIFEFGRDIEPVGMYYSFSYSTSSDPLVSLLTIQSNQAIVDLEDRVRFISDSICYVFLGEIFAITLDGGQSWTKWDAERDWPDWVCCDLPVIRQAQISPDGFGTMTLYLSQQKETGIILHTKDYGKHWGKD